MKRFNHIVRIFILVLFILLPQFQVSDMKGIGPDFPFMTFEQKKEQVFDNYVTALYADLHNSELSFDALQMGLKGYYKLRQENKLQNDSLISIADFTKTANEKRLFVIDLNNHKVLYNTYVAHGRNSGSEFATRFSNRKNSNMSSVGFFVTGQVYRGRQGLSLKLMGQEQSNDNAYQRGVVIHGADYVSEKFIAQFGRLGRSNGCPALPRELTPKIINLLKNNTCFYIHHPDVKYISSSYFVNQTDFLNCFDISKQTAMNI